MSKRIILLLLVFLCHSVSAQAGFWQAVENCLTDFCNCGDSNSEIDEIWDDESYYKRHPDDKDARKNRVCAPWNKGGGRDARTCLLKNKYPKPNIAYYENLCAEETPESSYFNPKIRVRGQQCNAFACWTTSNTLDWNGQCATLAGGYGFPLHRMCARIALPQDDVRGVLADPGYTKGVHLNSEGATKDDKIVLGYDGKPLVYDSPKLCLYRDPAFASEDGFDVMDLDPNRQPYHKTKETHPIVKVIIFFVRFAADIAETPADLLGALAGLMDNGEDGETTFWSVTQDLFVFLGEVIKWVGDVFIKILREVGQINARVDDTIYGCVNIPLGPFPPPFCEKIDSLFQSVVTHNICTSDASGKPVASVSSRECVVSKLKNNYIKNSIRVGYEDLIPLCKPGQPETDRCVLIENIEVYGSASAMHSATKGMDIIKQCDSKGVESVCVSTKKCSSKEGCRIVYGHKLGKNVTAKSYFRNDMNDCTGGAGVCQQIWGVNTGDFADISLDFPEIEEESNAASPLVKRFSLVDKKGDAQEFVASIVRESGYDKAHGFMQNTNQICVFKDNLVIGCSERAAAPVPRVYSCGTKAVPASPCVSTYFEPKFIVAYEVDGSSSSAVVEVESVYNRGAVDLVSLAGSKFRSFATDDDFMIQPFSSSNPRVQNPMTIMGIYQDNILPLINRKENPDAVYLTGLEYINGAYHLGGKHACLEPIDAKKCPDNPKMCVLAKLLDKEKKIVSYNSEDRIEPSASLGSTLSADQYYKIVSSSPSRFEGRAPATMQPDYDQTKYGLRDKTSIEMGLCVNVPQPTCAAVDDYSEENGYASWPETKVGEVATGTCKSGYHALKPLKRYCIPSSETKTFEFEPLYRGTGGSRRYTNVKCVKDKEKDKK